MSYGYLEASPTGNSCCRYETGFGHLFLSGLHFVLARISVFSRSLSFSLLPRLSSFVYVPLTENPRSEGDAEGERPSRPRAANCGINSRKDEYACQGGTKRVSLSRTGFPTWSNKSRSPVHIVEHVPWFHSSFGPHERARRIGRAGRENKLKTRLL